MKKTLILRSRPGGVSKDEALTLSQKTSWPGF